MDSGILLYAPGALLTLALLVKAPALRRDWHRPMMRAVCVLLVVGCLVLFLAAPPTIVAVNRLTGIPNCAAPLVYGVLTAFSGSCIVLVLHWSGTDPAAIRRGTRWTVSVTAAVTVLIVAAFVAGDAGVERVRDLDTYYANTPYVREMIVLYLLAHSAGSATLTVLSWKWLRRVRPAMRSLRGGLALLALGGLLDLGYLAAKWAAVGARWAGRDWDGLSTDLAPPLASGAAVLVGAGFLVPLVGASSAWREYSQYRALRPLCRALGGPAGSGAATVPLKWWSPVGIRLIHRESVINDAILALTPHCEAPVRARALDAALAQGLAPADAATVADAAMLAAAAARRCGTPPGRETERAVDAAARDTERAVDAAARDTERAVDAAAGDTNRPGAAPPAVRGHEAGPGADGRQEAGPGVEARLGSRPLAALAAEFRRSPVVAAARREASRAADASP
ncbi:DUF6545 domain-containing protein [Streptomyces sp. NPDC086023]|uniref:DUF6545 domain-containing protein n=1 Tax=Streptomyces sp. NPDC086023 TaxID=3365746 RepID=UPI0037D07549